MPTIRQLSPSLVNKIAAGEVIERPASVVKELLENSVDSGATIIELTIEGGGIELIRISDNGCGIEEHQIPLALASHATSKLETAEDLFDVHTLGFRGEALASIAEVSHLNLKTRTAESDSGAEISVRGGESTPILPTGCPVGTSIEIRHLFFNTPVRRKFLRTPQTEAGHIAEAFTRIALAFPHIQFTMRSGNRTQYELPATDQWKDRIRAFFGDEIGDSLIRVDSQQDAASLRGFVADPSISRSNNRMQYIFLNGRHIRDRSLQHALGEAYRGLLMVGRFPVCFLRLDLPPDTVDVNVHPTKMEVRFQEGGKLYSQLLKTLRHQFLTTDLTARARHVPGPVPAGLREKAPGTDADLEGGSSGSGPEAVDAAGISSRSEQRWNDHEQRLTSVSIPAAERERRLPLGENTPAFRPFEQRHRSGLGGDFRIDGQSLPVAGGITAGHTEADREQNISADGYADHRPQLPPGAAPWDTQSTAAVDADSLEADAHAPLPQAVSQQPRILRTDVSHARDAEHALDVAADGTVSPDAPHEHAFAPESAASGRSRASSAEIAHSHLGYQIHNRYLVTQDENGMVLVDQHALHERILYEQLRHKAEARTLESQRLLVPEPLDLTPSEAAAAIEFKEVLATIGIEIEPFGGDTILMTSYPAMLANMRPMDVLRQVLEPLMSGGKQPDARELLDELLNMLACKAAIKAGDKLSSEEITALLEQRFHFQDTHHCPHGRPTALFFSRDQLDKMFKRT